MPILHNFHHLKYKVLVTYIRSGRPKVTDLAWKALFKLYLDVVLGDFLG